MKNMWLIKVDSKDINIAVVGVLALWLFATLFVFHETALSMVEIWLQSKTFTHGFIILPLAIWLLWQLRWKLIELNPSVSYLGFVASFVFVAIALFGYVAKVNVIQHVALVGILISGYVSIVGVRIALRSWFPLSLLLFAVPIGEELIPMFQKITADISVAVVNVLGVPIFRNGLYIAIPEGKFEVAEACSGIRFFIVSVFLGYFYGCICFRSPVKRIAFWGFSIVLPVVANGLRVVMTILVGHFIDMKYASSADHLIYGWFFFFIVTVVLIAVGNYFSEKQKYLYAERNESIGSGWTESHWKKGLLVALIPLVSYLGLKAQFDEIQSASRVVVQEQLLPGINISRQPDSMGPSLVMEDGIIAKSIYGPQNLNYYVAWFYGNRTVSELISWNNRIFDIDNWSLIASEEVKLSADGNTFSARYLQLSGKRGPGRKIIYWYQVQGYKSGSAIKVKIRQAVNVLTGKSAGGVLVVVSTHNDRKTVDALVTQLENSSLLNDIDGSISFQ